MLHDLNHAAAVADRVVLLHHGRVRAAGDPADVLTAEHLTEVYGLADRTPRSTPRRAAVRVEPQRPPPSPAPLHRQPRTHQ